MAAINRYRSLSPASYTWYPEFITNWASGDSNEPAGPTSVRLSQRRAYRALNREYWQSRQGQANWRVHGLAKTRIWRRN